jgi:hypothetical protein
MGKLCKRLGEFVPGEYEDGRVENIAPEPVSPAHMEDWKEYRAERENTAAKQTDPTQADALAGMKKRHLQQRKRLARRQTGQPLSVLNPARHELAVKQKKERLSLTGPRSSSRPGSHSVRSKLSFKSWLKARGRIQQADRWRYRNRQFSTTPPPPPTTTKPDEALAAYAAHWAVQQKENARLAALVEGMALFCKVPSTLPVSSSRLDARIALLMRAEGHSREAVTEAIWHSAPELRQEEKRDWRRYSTRTTGYAFGLAGDMELARMQLPPRMEPKPEEAPPSHEEEAWRERPRLQMR